jgi:hypothetical protein
MATPGGFWGRVRNEVRTVSERTRNQTRRAVQIGVLRVDLVSLRRDRARAMSGLGERALALWNAGTPADLERDAEALRLRVLLGEIGRTLASKEEALARLRAGRDPAPAGVLPVEPARDDVTAS